MASKLRQTECEEQRAVFEDRSLDGEPMQMAQEHSRGMFVGLSRGQRKEFPAERQKKWRILDIDSDDHGPIHKIRSSEKISVDMDATPQPVTTEDNSILGPVTIDLMDDVVDEKCIWEDLAIIARIIGPKKPRRSITPWVEDNWGKHAVVKFLPKGFFVTIFAEKETRDQILNSKNWYFDNSPLYIQPWTPNFNPLQLAIYDSLVWIRLFNLPIEYWGDPCLEKIGRTLGTLLEIDEDIIENDSYVYARMKIAAVKQIPSHLNLITANGIWKQNIEIEKELHVCQKCGSKTHQTKRCRIFV
ncbi:hypothetical protein SUGI_0194680 [Cryptomeria japonica]|nr:hypothetical protein SUGI_0194680 [Cryptomeria japonica]